MCEEYNTTDCRIWAHIVGSCSRPLQQQGPSLDTAKQRCLKNARPVNLGTEAGSEINRARARKREPAELDGIMMYSIAMCRLPTVRP